MTNTLDSTIEQFLDAPNHANAAALITVATKYWHDDMIGDESYWDEIRKVRDWLLKQAQPR